MRGVTKDPAALQDKLVEDRRRFLASCGRFAMITPPTMTLLLALGRENFAVAGSGSAGSSLSSGCTFFPGDDIAAAGGAKPGDTICFNAPGGGTSCHGIPEPPK